MRERVSVFEGYLGRLECGGEYGDWKERDEERVNESERASKQERERERKRERERVALSTSHLLKQTSFFWRKENRRSEEISRRKNHLLPFLSFLIRDSSLHNI